MIYNVLPLIMMISPVNMRVWTQLRIQRLHREKWRFNIVFHHQEWDYYDLIWLVVWNMNFMTFDNIGNFIIPTDFINQIHPNFPIIIQILVVTGWWFQPQLTIIFQKGQVYHQPVIMVRIGAELGLFEDATCNEWYLMGCLRFPWYIYIFIYIYRQIDHYNLYSERGREREKHYDIWFHLICFAPKSWI